MSTNAQITRWIAQIDKRKDAIGKERDKLDDLISAVQDLKNDCEEAYEAMVQARDALSRLT